MLCDAEGRICVAAVAESVNGKELAEVLNNGVDCEVLNCKMDVEEPTAASVISQAFKKGHDLALRKAEWTALSVLKGGDHRPDGAQPQPGVGLPDSAGKGADASGLSSRGPRLGRTV